MKIMKFLSNIFGNIRCFLDEATGEIWFLANDVASILGYKNPYDAIKRHTAENDRKALSVLDSRVSREPQKDVFWESEADKKDKIFINESGLYCMIFGSHLETAQEFKLWVTKDVLPSIRKNGGYIEGQEELKADDRLALEETIRDLYAEVEKQVNNQKKLSKNLVWTEDKLFEAQESLSKVPDDVLKYYLNPEIADIMVKIIPKIIENVTENAIAGRENKKHLIMPERFIGPNGCVMTKAEYHSLDLA